MSLASSPTLSLILVFLPLLNIYQHEISNLTPKIVFKIVFANQNKHNNMCTHSHSLTPGQGNRCAVYPRQPKLVSAGVWALCLLLRRGWAGGRPRMRRTERARRERWGCKERSKCVKEEWRAPDKACEGEEKMRGKVRGWMWLAGSSGRKRRREGARDDWIREGRDERGRVVQRVSQKAMRVIGN